MKIEKGTIKLNNITFEATKIDFDEYDKEEGSINLNNKSYTSTKTIGVNNDS